MEPLRRGRNRSGARYENTIFVFACFGRGFLSPKAFDHLVNRPTAGSFKYTTRESYLIRLGRESHIISWRATLRDFGRQLLKDSCLEFRALKGLRAVSHSACSLSF